MTAMDLRGLDGLLDLLDAPFGNRDLPSLPDRLLSALGVPPMTALPLVEERDRWTWQGVDGVALRWNTGFGPDTDAWLLRPAGEREALPGLVALHCHGGAKRYGKEKIADGPDTIPASIRRIRAELYAGRALANDIARAGYSVLVHDAFGWGSRRLAVPDMSWRARRIGDLEVAASAADGPVDDDTAYDIYAGAAEDSVAKTLGVLGTSWAGVIARDDLIATGILESRPEVSSGGAVAVGLSGGGARAALLSALSPHLRGTAIVAMMSSLPALFDGHFHSHSWTMLSPGLGRVGDWPDVAACRVPRPLFVGYAAQDSLFPAAGMAAADRAIAARYADSGHPERYRSVWVDAPHSFPHRLQAAFHGWLAELTERNTP